MLLVCLTICSEAPISNLGIIDDGGTHYFSAVAGGQLVPECSLISSSNIYEDTRSQGYTHKSSASFYTYGENHHLSLRARAWLKNDLSTQIRIVPFKTGIQGGSSLNQ